MALSFFERFAGIRLTDEPGAFADIWSKAAVLLIASFGRPLRARPSLQAIAYPEEEILFSWRAISFAEKVAHGVSAATKAAFGGWLVRATKFTRLLTNRSPYRRQRVE